MNDGGRFDSRNTLVALVDEVLRTSGRLKSVFAEARRSVGLGESEMMVLNAVVEADRAPTVSQIGRSLGQPRQIVQRAANTLIAAKLIATSDNPDHKRAPLLVPTPAGTAVKRAADSHADAIAASLAPGIDLDSAAKVVKRLRKLRVQIETQLRQRGE